MLISRSDRSKKAIWFWTIDRWLFSTFLILISFGAFFIMGSGTKIASKLGLESHFFPLRHFVFLLFGFQIVLIFSYIHHKKLKLICILGLLITLILMMFTLFEGSTAKGAQRWISFLGQSIQPSEFLKPFFIVVNAWLLHLWKKKSNFKGWLWSSFLLFSIIFLLLLQPDIGMTILISTTWGFQLFLTGLPTIFLILLILLVPVILIFSYFNFDHVFKRINNFFEGNSYQAHQSLKSFESGNLFGKGLGEGSYKNHLPDAHTDFVFAVIAEEFGIILCCLILILYAIILFRSFHIAYRNSDLFNILAICGLSFIFGIQSLIHICSNIGLIPTKGMTLPFLSYGGSSILSSSIIIGIILSLTRKQINFKYYKNEISENEFKYKKEY